MSHTFNKEVLKAKVVKGRHDEVFEELRIDALHEDLQNQVRLLESRHRALEKSNNQGILAREAYTLERARIDNSLLQLIDEINEELSENTTPPMPTPDTRPPQPSGETTAPTPQDAPNPSPTPSEPPRKGANPLHAGIYMAIAIAGLIGIGWMLASGKMAEVSNLEGYTYLWLLGLCVAAFLFGGMSSFAEISGKHKSLELNLGRAFAGALIVVVVFYIAVGNEQPKDDPEPQKPVPVLPIDSLENKSDDTTSPREKPKKPLPKPQTPQPDLPKPNQPPEDPTPNPEPSPGEVHETLPEKIPAQPQKYQCASLCQNIRFVYAGRSNNATFDLYISPNNQAKQLIGKVLNNSNVPIVRGNHIITFKDKHGEDTFPVIINEQSECITLTDFTELTCEVKCPPEK